VFGGGGVSVREDEESEGKRKWHRETILLRKRRLGEKMGGKNSLAKTLKPRIREGGGTGQVEGSEDLLHKRGKKSSLGS